MIKKMYNEPKVEVITQLEPEQPVMILLGSGTAPEPAPVRDREV